MTGLSNHKDFFQISTLKSIRLFALISSALLLCLLNYQASNGATLIYTQRGQQPPPPEKRNTPIEREKHQVDKEMIAVQAKILRLHKRIEILKSQADEAEKAEKHVINELGNINRLLHEQLQKLEDLERKIIEQQKLIAQKAQEAKRLETDKETVQKHLQKRVGAFYKMGKIGFINVAFSTDSLPNLLSFHESFNNMIGYDREILNAYKAKLNELERARNASLLEQHLLQDFVNSARAEKEETTRLKTEKDEILTRIHTQKLLHGRAVQEMEEATDYLTKALASLQSRRNDLDQEFKLSRGKLPFPAQGTIVALFNEEKYSSLGTPRKAPGIAIEVPDQTDVIAIADGTVIYAGYMRGYGNTVIIDHGYNYTTLTSRLGSVLQKNGSTVQSGSIIGRTSDTTTLIDEGIYFEVRYKNKPQDPLSWLKKTDQ